METDRLRRMAGAFSRALEGIGGWCLWRGGAGEREGERLVEMVDTESAEEVDGEREQRRSASFCLSRSSARPLRRTRTSGTSVVSLGCSLGLSSCCVREGRDLYGRSWAEALHS